MSLIVPCYNEEGNLRELVGRLAAVFDIFRMPAEIVLVDDCSRDGTRALIQERIEAACDRLVAEARAAPNPPPLPVEGVSPAPVRS